MSFNRILIAVDSSAAAAHAGEIGIDLARSLAAEVALVHAVDPGAASIPETGVPASELLSRAEQEGRALLTVFSALVQSSAPPFEFVEVGKPADVILKVAAEWRAELIVIASHGRGGVRRLVLGSVAEGVMRHSTCPVVVVRALE